MNRLRDIWIELTLQTYRKRLEDQKERAEAIVLERDQTYRLGLEALQKFERDFDVASLKMLLFPKYIFDVAPSKMLLSNQCTFDVEPSENTFGHYF